MAFMHSLAHGTDLVKERSGPRNETRRAPRTFHLPNMMTIALAVLAMLQDKGAPAPDFSAPNQDGKVIRFADFKGKKNVLLAFYPKDNTPG